MAKLQFESPLAWPEGMETTPRAQQRSDHGFSDQMTLAESLAYLEEEVAAVATKGTLYLDIEHPNQDRLRKKVGSRSGACLTLRIDGMDYVLACDRWQLPEHNIYALHLALRQWRNMERWGLGGIPQLLNGFCARVRTAGDSKRGAVTLPPWMEEMGLGPSATLDDAIAIYHRRAKQLTQDTDGMARLNGLMEEARAHFSVK
jgi:hypothetical protein